MYIDNCIFAYMYIYIYYGNRGLSRRLKDVGSVQRVVSVSSLWSTQGHFLSLTIVFSAIRLYLHWRILPFARFVFNILNKIIIYLIVILMNVVGATVANFSAVKSLHTATWLLPCSYCVVSYNHLRFDCVILPVDILWQDWSYKAPLIFLSPHDSQLYALIFAFADV